MTEQEYKDSLKVTCGYCGKEGTANDFKLNGRSYIPKCKTECDPLKDLKAIPNLESRFDTIIDEVYESDPLDDWMEARDHDNHVTNKQI